MYQGIFCRQTFKFVWSCDKIISCFFLQVGSYRLSKPFISVQACANRCSTLCNHQNIWHSCFNSLDSLHKLKHITTELLSEGQRCRILSMSTSNFDNIFELVLFCLESFYQPFEVWKKSLIGFQHSSDMHDSWKGIIRRL